LPPEAWRDRRPECAAVPAGRPRIERQAPDWTRTEAKMSPALMLILGGARSGKSAWAIANAARCGERVLVVATAEPLDEDMSARIREHRRCRPPEWDTLEEPRRVAERLAGLERDYDVIVLDCLTMLLSNWMLAERGHGDPQWSDDRAAIAARMSRLAAALRARAFRSMVISNEVGAGIVPESEVARRYRDALGHANQALAKRADCVVLMVAGIPVHVKGAAEIR
jgi:adenosylcobinamide kinase/adenosylcobinamide-phosphate guanylyltransferase